MSYVPMKFLELHVVHDPDKGEATVEMVGAAGEERVRWTVKGRYRSSEDEPTVSLDVNQPTYESGLQLYREVLPYGPSRFAVGLGCHMDVVEMTRERLPATDEVAPPSGDEINNGST